MVDFTNNTFDGKTTIYENPLGKIEEHLSFGNLNGNFTRNEVSVYNDVQKIVPKNISEELLADFFDAFVRNDWEQAHKHIKPLVNLESFCSFDPKRRKSIGNTYLNFCWIRKNHVEALEWHSSLPDEIQLVTEFRAWKTLIDRDANDSDVTDTLKGLFWIEKSNPTVLSVLMESGIDELQEPVAEVLRAWLEDNEKTSSSDNYYAFTCLAEYESEKQNFEQARKALDAIRHHTEEGVYNSLKFRLFYAQINFTEITSNPSLIECIHLPISLYAPLRAIEDEVQDIVQKYRELNFHQVNALDTLAVIKSLLYKPEEALEIYKDLEVQELPTEIITHVLGCYQEVNDYEAIVNVIESLSEEKQSKLNNYWTLALISLGRWDKALEVCPLDAPERKLIDSELTMSLEDIDDLYYSMQMAYHKYNAAADDEEKKSSCIEFLLGLTPQKLRYRITRAYYLFQCEQAEVAIELYEEIFTEVGAGYGRAFADFMYALQQTNLRKRSDFWFSKFSNETPLEAYMPLKHHHLTFIQITKNIAAFKKEIEKTIGKIPEKFALPYRTRWIQATLQHKNWKQQVQDKVQKWGLWPEGRLNDQLDYLRVVSHCLEPEEVFPEWYKQILEQPREADLLENYILYILSLHGKNATFDWTYTGDVVQDKCAVELSDGEILVFDTEASSISKVSDVLSSDIRYAQDFIGKSVGDTVSDNLTIQAIYSPYLWAYKYAEKQLPKYKDSDRFHQISVPKNGTPEEMLAPLMDLLKQKADYIAGIEQTIFDNKLPYLTVMGHIANNVQAWNTFLTKDTDQRFGFSYSIDQHLLYSLKGKTKAVLDITVLVGLGILYGKPDLIQKLWPEVAAVSQAIQQIFYDREEAIGIQPNNMTMGWDRALNAPTKSSHSEESVQKYISNCSVIIEAYDEKKITAIDSVPAHEITDADKKLIEILEASSRDSLLACYGHEDRFFVTDDPNLASLSQRIGITTLNSCQLMFMMYANKVIDLDEFSEWFIISSTGGLNAESVAGVVLEWLMEKEDYNQRMFEKTLEKLLPDPALTISNMRFLVDILDKQSDKETLTDSQQHVIEHLLQRMTSNGKDAVTLERILIEARRDNIKNSDAVVAMVIKHSGYSYKVVHSKEYITKEIRAEAMEKYLRDINAYMALKYHNIL
ncbi:tetratricopeptide repeat protein [Endozoicomonas ascidiicola]|uniref:tetratricopeptide repeat protein n=1 Tax=Endozoicomonas ascidiicola TaxID=1698521 RepID=UPI0008310459|nr:hypothetical protein [Endozoicomonas ascidiicola]